MQNSILRIETLTGPAITIQDTQVHLRSQIVQLRFSRINGGVIWNRPVAVVVRTLEGKEKIVPIPDPTRYAMLTLSGLCFIGMLLLISLKRKQAES